MRFGAPRANKIILFAKVHWAVLSVCAITIFVAAQTLGNQLIWDDAFLIRENPNIGVPGAFLDILWRPYWQNSVFTRNPLTGYWRPVTSLVLWAIGLVSKVAWLYHLLSVLIAMATAMLSAFVIHYWGPNRPGWSAALVAGFFYFLHPITAETYCMVANIADHFAMGFLLLCLLVSLRFAASPNWTVWLPLVAVFAFLSCASKEFGVLVIMVPILTHLHHKLQRDTSLGLRNLLGLWIAVVVPVATFLMLRHAIIQKADFTQSLNWSTLNVQPFLIGYGVALKQIFFLRPIATETIVDTPYMYMLLTILAFLVMLSAVAYGYVKRNQKVLYYTGIALFAIVLLTPSFLTVIPNGNGWYEFPNRYFHLGVLGTSLIFAGGIDRLANSNLGQTCLCAIAILLGSQSVMRISQWTDPITLFSEEVRINPSSEKATISLAESFLDVHAFTRAEDTVESFKAQQDFKNSSNRAQSYSILSQVAYMRDGNIKKAIPLAKKAIETSPYDPLFILRLVTILKISGHGDHARALLHQALRATGFPRHQKQQFRDALEFIEASKIGTQSQLQKQSFN